MLDPPFSWDVEDEPVVPLARGHHQHHHHGNRRIPSPWALFPPGIDRGMLSK